MAKLEGFQLTTTPSLPPLSTAQVTAGMAFSHSENNAISQSTFNEAGRDQILQVHCNYIQIEQMNLSLFQWPWNRRPQALHFRSSSNPNTGESMPATPSQNSVRAVAPPPCHSSTIGTTINLIAKLVNLLTEGQNQGHDEYRHLTQELQTLHQSLALIETAVEANKNKPIQSSLLHAVAPAVNQCCKVLEDLLYWFKGTRYRLGKTNKKDIWRTVRRLWDRDRDFSLLKTNLDESQNDFRGFLEALDSYVPLTGILLVYTAADRECH